MELVEDILEMQIYGGFERRRARIVMPMLTGTALHRLNLVPLVGWAVSSGAFGFFWSSHTKFSSMSVMTMECGGVSMW